MAWDRNTPWRQGHVVPDDAAKALGLIADAGEVAVVISHDCDIAQAPANESAVEIIVGRRIAKLDGNFTFGKAARRLHIDLSGGATALKLDLSATQKRSIEKERLAKYQPMDGVALTHRERETFQRGLAARYRRSAFPDEFDRRLGDSGLQDRLGRILRRLGAPVSAIYFDLDKGEDRTRTGPEDVYELGIYLLHDADSEPGRKTATDAAVEIADAFRAKCCSKAGVWHDIELIFCEPITDEAMTIAAARLLKVWNVEHLSLRDDGANAILQ